MKKVLFIPDVHAPFVDEKAFSVMLKTAKLFKPDVVTVLGDFFDCYSVSKYDKSPERAFLSLDAELKMTRPFLTAIENLAAKRFVFLEGNHEARINKFITAYAAVLCGLKSTREILGLSKKWEFYPYGQGGHVKFGKLLATHGTLCGKHVAASMVSKYLHSVIFGHVHKIQEYQIRRYDNSILRGVTCGWLGDIRRAAEYIKDTADWANGFAIAYIKPCGQFFLQVIPIINNEALFEGKIIKHGR